MVRTVTLTSLCSTTLRIIFFKTLCCDRLVDITGIHYGHMILTNFDRLYLEGVFHNRLKQYSHGSYFTLQGFREKISVQCGSYDFNVLFYYVYNSLDN